MCVMNECYLRGFQDCISVSKVDMRVEGEEVVEGREGCKVRR